jgi:hypothetical protein
MLRCKQLLGGIIKSYDPDGARLLAASAQTLGASPNGLPQVLLIHFVSQLPKRLKSNLEICSNANE